MRGRVTDAQVIQCRSYETQGLENQQPATFFTSLPCSRVSCGPLPHCSSVGVVNTLSGSSFTQWKENSFIRLYTNVFTAIFNTYNFTITYKLWSHFTYYFVSILRCLLGPMDKTVPSPVVLTLHGAAESLGPVNMQAAGPSAAAAVGQSLRMCFPNKIPGAAAGPLGPV